MRLQRMIYNGVVREFKDVMEVDVRMTCIGKCESCVVYVWSKDTEIVGTVYLHDIKKLTYKQLCKRVLNMLTEDNKKRVQYETTKSIT